MKKLNSILLYIYAIAFFLLVHSKYGFAASSCNCDFTVEANVLYVDGASLKIFPGATVCLKSSVKKYLGFANLHGTPEKPITIINCGGKVTIKNTDWYYGVRFNNCTNFRITGTGDAKIPYGIAVLGTPNQISGITIGMLSSEIEVDHVEVAYTGFAGIMAKTDPDCGGIPNRGNFVQKNTFIHDNYIHDTKGEGIYLGFPHYRGIPETCNGVATRLLPHELAGVRVYNNTISNVGREGIQIGCATNDVKIYSNKIEKFGKLNEGYQSAGIHLSTGTTGELYKNLVTDGSGPGLWLNGLGDNYVYNNIFSDVAGNGQMAMLLEDSLVAPGKGYHIINNTILSKGTTGVKMNTNFGSSNNEFLNNILVTAGADNFFDIADSTKWKEAANIKTNDIDALLFQQGFMLSENSPMVDEGVEVSGLGLSDDFNGDKRPRGNGWDIGAIESPYSKQFEDFAFYPSPFAGEAKVVFYLKEDSEVSLGLYDERGVLVKEIIPPKLMHSMFYKYSVTDADLSSGIYFCRLQRGKKFKSKKVVVLK